MKKWNGKRFSIYQSEEKSVLGLIKELGKFTNYIFDGLKGKTDLYGDHKGSWQGITKPTISNEGLRGAVDNLLQESDENKRIKVSAESLGMLPNEDITTILNNLPDIKLEIEFIKGAEYFISDTVHIDIFKHNIKGNGCIWSSKILQADKYTLKLRSSLTKQVENIRVGGSPTANNGNKFENIILQTEKILNSRQCNGILCDNTLGDFAHIVLENITVLGFNKGITLGDECYMITFDKIVIAYCNSCIYTIPNSTNSGERISFRNGCISDSDLCIEHKLNGQALHFNNISFDFSYKLFYSTGLIFMSDCHLEAPLRFFDNSIPEKKYWGELDEKGKIFISNSRITVGYAELGQTQYTLPYLVKSNTEYNMLMITNSWISLYFDYLMNDVGIVRTKGLVESSTYSPYVYSQKKCNIFHDILCIRKDNLKSSIMTTPPTINNGYEFTHITQGTEQTHSIKLPPIKSHFKLSFDITTNIEKTAFFKEVNIFTRDTSSGYTGHWGSMNTINGTKTLTMHSRTRREDGRYFNPNMELQLQFKTLDLPSGTKFTINNLKITPLDTEQ